jgi:hypothetical protein
MNVRTVIAVAFGLLFQWAQMAHAVVSTEAGGNVSAVHCDCCADLPSCPCASDGEQEPDRSPLPVLPDTVKLPAAKICETRVSLEIADASQTTRRAIEMSMAQAVAGYAGVSLAVAFCSFVM